MPHETVQPAPAAGMVALPSGGAEYSDEDDDVKRATALDAEREAAGVGCYRGHIGISGQTLSGTYRFLINNV